MTDDDKLRDICRSILPSTSRKSAREMKAKVNRRHRKATRQRLRDLRDYDLAIEADDDLSSPFYDREIKAVMWDRRGADKIGPLKHWAEAITERDLAKMSEAERYEFFRDLLPSDKIGRHALSHLYLRQNPTQYGYFYPRTPRIEPFTRDDLIAKLRLIIETKGAHRRFNSYIASPTIPFHTRRVRIPGYVGGKVPEGGRHDIRVESTSYWTNGYYTERYICEHCPHIDRHLEGLHDVESFADYCIRNGLRQQVENFEV